MPISIEERQRRSLALKEYRENITPEQKRNNIEKARQTRENNNPVKNAIKKVLDKQYNVFDSATGKSKQMTGWTAMYSELMKTLFDKETTPQDKLKIVESLANYAGYKPTEKKETTNNNNYSISWEDMIKKMSEPQEVEVIEENAI